MKKKQASFGTIKLPGYRQSEKNIIDDPSAIICCEADDHCTKIHRKDGTVTTHTVCLKYMECMLNPLQFCRIHKEEIINLSFVEEWYRERSIIVVKLPHNELVFVAQRKKHEFIVSYKYFLSQTRD